MTAEYSQRWTHAYTYSGHPTCCAVGLKNLEILEREGGAEQAKQRGRQLLAGLQSLQEQPRVGDVRGLGLMCAVEFVADKDLCRHSGAGRTGCETCRGAADPHRDPRDILAFAP